MKPEFKVMIAGAVMCIVGAILLDCNIVITGWTFMGLGLGAIFLGPTVVM